MLTELDEFFSEYEINNVSVFENKELGFSEQLDENGFPIANFFDVEIYTEETALLPHLLQKRFGNDIRSIEIDEISANDWVDSYLKELKPIVCDKFYFYNELLQAPPENNELIPIKINSALAFGSGHHQTTQACLMNMRFLKERMGFVPQRILDMGCGTGILGICAKKVWTDAELLGIDIDPEAVKITRANYKSNNIDAEAIVAENLTNVEGKFDLVFCNILKQPLITLCPDFANAMNVGAYIITSGYIVSQETEIIDCYVANGFEVTNRIQMDEWVSIIFKKR